jgi:hypothetical protein
MVADVTAPATEYINTAVVANTSFTVKEFTT